MFRSKLSLAVLISLLSVFSINAQTDTSSCKNKFEFMFVNGYSITYSTNLTPCSALRYKLDLDINWNKDDTDSDRESSIILPDQSSSNNYSLYNDENYNSQDISFAVQYLWINEINSKVKLSVGAGPFLEFSRSHDNYKSGYVYESGNSNDYENNRDSHTFGVGLLGSIGLQCDLTESLSIVAQYDLTLKHGWTKSEIESTNTDPSLKNIQKTNNDTNTWSFDLSSIKLGVGFRF